jgi:hypothetical protein
VGETELDLRFILPGTNPRLAVFAGGEVQALRPNLQVAGQNLPGATVRNHKGTPLRFAGQAIGPPLFGSGEQGAECRNLRRIGEWYRPNVHDTSTNSQHLGHSM